MKINLVQQRKNGCVLACIAMMTGYPLDAIYEIYPEFNGEGVNTEDTILIFKRLGYDPVQYMQPKLFPKRLYIVTTPSLNKPGHNHAVVIADQQVFDPNNGVDGELYYTTDTFKSWAEVIELVVENDERVPRRNNIDQDISCMTNAGQWSGCLSPVWDSIDPNIQYITMDADGTWFGWLDQGHRPYYNDIEGEWHGKVIRAYKTNIPFTHTDPKNALYIRPGAIHETI